MNTKHILLTGGRAPVALELARLFASAGHRVFVADSLPKHLCHKSKSVIRSFLVPKPSKDGKGFIDALENIINQEKIDYLIPTCEEIMYVSQGIERLNRSCRIVSAPFEQLRRLHNKWEFICCAEQHGFQVPQTELIHSTERWSQIALEAANQQNKGIVLKPVYSRFASKVRIFGASSASSSFSNEISQAVREVPQVSSDFPWVAQQFIKGRQICTYSIAYEGRLVAHAAYTVVYTAGRGACIYFEPLNHAKAEEWVSRFVQLECFTGQIAFDLIEGEDGQLYPIECNPRATSGIHLFRQEDHVERAFVEPHNITSFFIKPQAAARAMLSVPMLTYGLCLDWSIPGIGKWLKSFAKARDAVFRWSDPAPFLAQLPMLAQLNKISRQQRISLLEAATFDLEWNGDT